MKKILLPISLRSDFDNALNYATSIAQKSNACLYIVVSNSSPVFKHISASIYTPNEIQQEIVDKISRDTFKQAFHGIIANLNACSLDFRVIVKKANLSKALIEVSQEDPFDLIVLPTQYGGKWYQIFNRLKAHKLIGELEAPALIVPKERHYKEITHIAYATDLHAYHAKAIQHTKAFAGLFDASLSITHVNEEEEDENEEYLANLQQTISDTIDYPKVYYRFFDHNDIMGGIQKFVNLSGTSILAMTNKKKTSWFQYSEKSLTRKMAQKLSIPLLAFHQ